MNYEFAKITIVSRFENDTTFFRSLVILIFQSFVIPNAAKNLRDFNY